MRCRWLRQQRRRVGGVGEVVAAETVSTSAVANALVKLEASEVGCYIAFALRVVTKTFEFDLSLIMTRRRLTTLKTCHFFQWVD